jgi:hypothetical protein
MYPCYRDFLAYLCSPVSRVLDASNARSHILEAGTADARLANVITTCVNANPSRPAKDTIRSLMSFGVCDGTARLLSKDEIISVSSGKGASTPEDVSDVPNCH